MLSILKVKISTLKYRVPLSSMPSGPKGLINSNQDSNIFYLIAYPISVDDMYGLY